VGVHDRDRPDARAAGFDVRVPKLSRRKPAPSLRLFAEGSTGSVVGAHQLSNVAWSVLFDDVELTADEVARLAKQARPLVQSRGRGSSSTGSTSSRRPRARRARVGDEAHRRRDPPSHDRPRLVGLRGGVVVEGDSWATEILAPRR
jgi:hypothetical protein